MQEQKHRLHTTKSERKLAYHFYEGSEDKPVVVFLGGFKSDMEGTKALFLQNLCVEKDVSFIRFDYSGHGNSEGKFEDGSIGEWCEDALNIIDNIGFGRKVLLIGSSMGGWISLLCAIERAENVTGLILLAPAPDFTREVLDQFNEEQRLMLEKDGFVSIPNDYSDEPYIFTKKLIEDGEQHCLLDKNISIDVPVIILQGKQDLDVPWEKAIRIQENLSSENVEIILIKDADHRLSREQDLERLEDALDRILF